jgi:hypothetical protein
VLDGDLVSEVFRRLGAGVRDQCLVRVQLQLEVLTQELGQALPDLLGFGSGSGEPEEGVVGLCGLPDYAARLVFALVPAAGSADGRHNRRAGQRVLTVGDEAIGRAVASGSAAGRVHAGEGAFLGVTMTASWRNWNASWRIGSIS